VYDDALPTPGDDAPTANGRRGCKISGLSGPAADELRS
jgi:hypothetical protein